MRRFYREVTTRAEDGGHGVLLDGKPVQTPARRPLIVPTPALAKAIAAEWAQQGDDVDTQAMRLTKLATTAIDLMPERRGDAVAEAAGYGGTDLLCYRATSPRTLAERQARTWQPWLDWAERQYPGLFPGPQADRSAPPYVYRHYPSTGHYLGVAGNDATTLATIAAMAGRPIHLTHLQFHSYGKEAGFSSGAAEIAALVNKSPNVSVDVGQVMFGQTVTASGDTMSQVRNAKVASPKKWVAMDIECEAGCGVLPFRYRDRNLVNALQWCIGLELFLLVEDPWRIFLTTDHPNGAPFTTYPHLIRLLMDASFRRDMLATIHKGARARSALGAITREYTLQEIAIISRAGPARILGIERSHGHLGPGAVADVTVYRDRPEDREAMFAAPALLLKGGKVVMREGTITEPDRFGATHVVRPGFDAAIRGRVERFFTDYRGMRLSTFELADHEIEDGGRGALVIHDCHQPA